MYKIKRLITVSLMFLISNIFTAMVFAKVDGPSVFWKFSLWGKRRAFTEGAETLSKRLAEETNGKFQLKIFYGGQLSKSKENLDGLKANSFEMAAFCNFYHPGKNAGLMVLTMPFYQWAILIKMLKSDKLFTITQLSLAISKMECYVVHDFKPASI